MRKKLEIIEFQDKKWLLKFVTNSNIPQAAVDWFKLRHKADVVLAKDNQLFFVEEIKSVEFEEIN